MIKLKIDGKEVHVPENTSVLEAAESVGIVIPTMCFMKGYSNNPSCMVCLVKDATSNNFFASCARQAEEGMDILSSDNEVHEARKEALQLLLADHVGDCEAPCRNGCPAFMNIPLMNRLIAGGKFAEALRVVKEEIALPLILGHICDAPCEKVCRRVPIDGPVSICQLKKFVAATDLQGNNPYLPEKEKQTGKKVAVIGSGPAGLAAAFHVSRLGHQCVIFDKNSQAGGSLLNLDQTTLPAEALKAEVDLLKKFGVDFNLDKMVDPQYFKEVVKQKFDSIILAIGEINEAENDVFGVMSDGKGVMVNKDTWETDVEGIFACGGAIKKQQLAIRVVAQGKGAARSVNDYLNGRKPAKKTKMFNSRFGKLKTEEYSEYLKESVGNTAIIPFRGEQDGFIREEAIAEAARCMHCDCRKQDGCKLRIFSDEYGADRRKYLLDERKTLRKQYTHETVVYEQEKCIKCGLCVEIAANDKELTGLSFIGRGFNVRVDVPFNRKLNLALTNAAARCAEACPTAAISFKEES